MCTNLYDVKNYENLPITYTYNGTTYNGLPCSVCTLLKQETVPYRGGETITTEYTFLDNLTIRVVQTLYPVYDASEITVYFINNGSENSGILSDVHSKLTFVGENPILNGILGDHDNFYKPYENDLTQEPVTFTSDSGRATHVNFPYFHLAYGDVSVSLAIGWAGTWTADFRYENGVTTYTARSVNRLHTYLKPGEQIRTALFTAVPCPVRDDDTASNIWRKWFLDCSIPKADAQGNAVQPFSTCCLSSDTGLPNSDGSISERYFTWKPSLDKMMAEDCKVDFRWVDAGWYSDPKGNYVESDWWGTVGSWELCKTKWPDQTFKESTDYARAHGMKTLMWFEPERVTDPEALAANYGYNPDWAIQAPWNRALTNNIGNPDCLAWTTERVCKVLRENRVEMYREDNNSDPGKLWVYLDESEGENRCGITESRMIEAHYKLWDDIIACTLSIGGCGFCDSCASGGGRNDLESLRRGIPLLRSDYDRESTAMRLSMTTSFNKWVPFCGAINKEKLWQLDPKGVLDEYVWRASYLPIMNVDSQFVQDPDQDFGVIRKGLQEWKQLNRYLLKDFYVHTAWKNKDQKNDFTAYSFFDPEEGKGICLIFRMEECEADTITIRYTYVDPNCEYTLTDANSGEVTLYTGAQLQAGISFTLPEKRSTRLLWVARK